MAHLARRAFLRGVAATLAAALAASCTPGEPAGAAPTIAPVPTKEGGEVLGNANSPASIIHWIWEGAARSAAAR